MENTNRESLLEAVNALVRAEDAASLFADVQALIPVARNLGARFSGDRAVLNPLVSLALSNPTQYQNVVKLIESKREAEGSSPLIPPADEGFDKTDYMREFMQQKRERERRAVEIENLQRPEATGLKGRTRLDFMQMQSSRWNTQREELLKKARDAQGGRLPKSVVQEILTAFWARVDKELDELEEQAKRKRLGGA